MGEEEGVKIGKSDKETKPMYFESNNSTIGYSYSADIQINDKIIQKTGQRIQSCCSLNKIDNVYLATMD